ncbi:hypothetical protein ACFQZW_12855 [Lutibacter aestuarii]|uniref:Uncharacterized protein n=1 Tax=Lutibacter aestuarii TaxID=861111 RepID=A0ABW2Z8G9_9FLAO
MTVEQKNYLKNNWLTLANLLVLLTLAYNLGVSQTKIEKDIDVLKLHANDINLHMPFEKKIEVFVPRVELDSRLKNMETMLERIEQKMDR